MAKRTVTLYGDDAKAYVDRLQALRGKRGLCPMCGKPVYGKVSASVDGMSLTVETPNGKSSITYSGGGTVYHPCKCFQPAAKE